MRCKIIFVYNVFFEISFPFVCTKLLVVSLCACVSGSCFIACFRLSFFLVDLFYFILLCRTMLLHPWPRIMVQSMFFVNIVSTSVFKVVPYLHKPYILQDR